MDIPLGAMLDTVAIGSLTSLVLTSCPSNSGPDNASGISDKSRSSSSNEKLPTSGAALKGVRLFYILHRNQSVVAIFRQRFY
jgi:hypothetical protein